MMCDLLAGYKYDKNDTISSPIIVKGTLLDYAKIVKREGGKTQIKEVVVIDVDAIKNSLGISPTPSSMDIAFVISKINEGSEEKKYILADFKFNVTSPNRVNKNISNNSIRAKFKFSLDYISSKDKSIPCFDIAFFIFKDIKFEQVRNSWSRRNLNSPMNMAIKQSDFEIIF